MLSDQSFTTGIRTSLQKILRKEKGTTVKEDLKGEQRACIIPSHVYLVVPSKCKQVPMIHLNQPSPKAPLPFGKPSPMRSFQYLHPCRNQTLDPSPPIRWKYRPQNLRGPRLRRLLHDHTYPHYIYFVSYMSFVPSVFESGHYLVIPVRSRITLFRCQWIIIIWPQHHPYMERHVIIY